MQCVVVCCAGSCGAVLCCCALCRFFLWPAVLCCGLLSAWLAALFCGAGCCAALLSLGALLPCAVPRGAVLRCGAVVSRPAALFVFVLCPVVLCFRLVLCCGASSSFLPCWWRWLSASPEKSPVKPVKMVFHFVKINSNYTLRNPLASSKTTFYSLTYVLPFGLHGVVVEGNVALCWLCTPNSELCFQYLKL